MTHEEALTILCRHLWLYEELRVRDGNYLGDEYFEARDTIVPEYKGKFSELQDWWRKEELK